MTLTLLCGGNKAWAEAVTATITFGPNNVKISSTSVFANDSQGNTWNINTEGTTSFTNSSENDYSQIGSKKKPATNITFTTTLPSEMTISNFSAKFGGFSETAGTISMKVDDTEVGTGSLNETSDVTVNNTSSVTGKVLTITVTNIQRGVKCYNISVTYEGATTTPTLKASSTTLSFPNTEANTSSTQTFTLSGKNLTGDATLSPTSTSKSFFNKISVCFRPSFFSTC